MGISTFSPMYTVLTYKYICIYYHPQAYCFVVSKLFNVVRHVGHLKLGSKPTQLYVRDRIIPLSQQANHVSSGIIRHYAVLSFVYAFALPDTRVLNLFEKLCIMRMTAVNSFSIVLNPRWGVYILSSTDRLLRERERERERGVVSQKYIDWYSDTLMCTHTCTHAHIHTHTHTYIYKCIYIIEACQQHRFV